MTTRLLSYSGGLNTKNSPGTILPNQLLNCDNFYLYGQSLKLRNGAYQIGTIVGGGNTIFYYNAVGASKEFFVGNGSSAKLWVIQNGGAGATTDITGAASLQAVGAFEVLNGVLFYGDLQLYQWSGAGTIAAVGGSSPTIPNILKVVNNFLFAASLGGSVVYWSNVGDGTIWTIANQLSFRKSDGDSIMALSSISNDLIIFKNHSIGRLSTQTITISGSVTLGPLTTIAEDIGAIGPNSVGHLPDGRLVFLASNNHVYVFDGSTFVDISDPPVGSNVQSILDSNVTTTQILSNYVEVYPVRQEIWVIPSGASIGLCALIYNYVSGVWSIRINSPGISALNSSYSTTTSPLVGFQTVNSASTGVLNNINALVSIDSGGKVWLEDSSSGTRSAPTSTVEISIPIPADDRPNYPRFVVVPLKSSTTGQSVLYYTGRDGTYGSSTTFTTTGGWDRLKIPIPANAQATYFQVKITYSVFVSLTIDPAYISNEADQ